MNRGEYTARAPIRPQTLVKLKAAAKENGMFVSFIADRCLAREAEKILAKTVSALNHDEVGINPAS